MDERKNKTIMALSRAQYRNVTIFELQSGYSFILGDWDFVKLTLQEATDYIDQWLEHAGHKWTVEEILNHDA